MFNIFGIKNEKLEKINKLKKEYLNNLIDENARILNIEFYELNENTYTNDEE